MRTIGLFLQMGVVFRVGVHTLRALLFGVYIRAPDFFVNSQVEGGHRYLDPNSM